MKVILIDDEPIALELLKSLLSPYPDIEIVGAYTQPMVALKKMKDTRPDVIFLDIEMGSINGLEIVEYFIRERNSIEIAFITAYSKYAVDAFEINAIDYLLKPIQQKRLDKTIKRLRDRFNQKEKPAEEIDNCLKVDCFDSFHVMDSKGRPLIWRTKKSKELFAYLLVYKTTPIPKDVITERIFPDKSLEQASTLIHTTIYQIRKNLEKLGFENSILYYNGKYQLNVPIDYDFDRLKDILDCNHHDPQDIEEIINLYKGDFLKYEGYHWALGIQADVKQSVLDILIHFTNTQLEANSRSFILRRTLEFLYKIEPFDDNIAENIIQYYAQQGNSNKLKQFFRNYAQELQQELNIKPKESTIQLYKKHIESITKPLS